jgi:lipoprotein-releasing system permease protein
MRLRFVLNVCFRFFSREWHKRSEHKQLRNAVFGIALSLVPLILVQEVANGMIEGITRRYLEIGSFHLQVKHYGEPDKKDAEFIESLIEEVEGVKHVIPIKQGLGLVYSEETKQGVTLRGVPADVYDTDEGFQRYFTILRGSFNLKKDEHILLSEETANKLSLSCGDTVKLITAKSLPGRPPILRPSSYTVSGIFTTGYFELDKLSLYISEDQGWRVFSGAGSFFFGIKVHAPYSRKELRNVKEEIGQILPSDWYVYSWRELEGNMYRSLEMTKRILLFIMAMIIIVASVTISSSLIMLVMEKQEEIAIMKSIGAQPGEITMVFLLAGGICGLSGAVLGTLAGLFLSVNINEAVRLLERLINGIIDLLGILLSPIWEGPSVTFRLLDPSYYLTEIPLRLYWPEITGAMAFTIFLSILAATIPAAKAGRTKPLDILRKH